MDILQACDLKKTYGTGEACVHALDGVSLNVEKGEFVAIVGTSGSGKSTLLHMLGGLDRPSSGKVFVDGKDIFSLKDEELTIFRRRKIGFVFQAYNLVPVLNVYENIVLGLVHGIAHTLSAHFHLAHGVANATVLPYVMEYNADSCPEKMVNLAKAIDLPVSGDLAKDKYLLSKELLKMTKTVGIKTLSELGVEEKDFEMIAEDVLKEPVLGFNPKQGVTKEDVISILKKAL